MILKFLFDRVVAFMKQTKRETIADLSKCLLLSLLSDSNQRPRDYKSRALAN